MEERGAVDPRGLLPPTIISGLDGVRLPTIYDQFGDPKEQPREVRVKTTADIFYSYNLVAKNDQITKEEAEVADIELDTFIRWMDLSDDERQEAQQIAREMELDLILAPSSDATIEQYAAALYEKAEIVAARERNR